MFLLQEYMCIATSISCLIHVHTTKRTCLFYTTANKACVCLKQTRGPTAVSPSWELMPYQRALDLASTWFRTCDLPVTRPLLYHWAITPPHLPYSEILFCFACTSTLLKQKELGGGGGYSRVQLISRHAGTNIFLERRLEHAYISFTILYLANSPFS